MTSHRSPTAPNAGRGDADSYAVLYGRSARIGLLCLVFLTIIFACGALVIKHKLESFRVDVLDEARQRTGTDLQIGTVIVNGLRGLRIDNLDVEFAPRNAPRVRVQAPSAYVDINVAGLVYGEIAIERIRIDHSIITLHGDGTAAWADGRAGHWTGQDMLHYPAFRVTGQDCVLKVEEAGSRLEIRDLAFDVSHLADAADLSARITGTVHSESPQQLDVRLRYASLSDFDARAQLDAVAIDDVARLVPDAPRFVESGNVAPSLRLAGYPDNTLVLSCTAPFRDLRIVGQPEFISPMEGIFTALATYRVAERELVVSTAQISAEQLQGTLTGRVAFDRESPALDLELRADRWPVAEVANLLVQQRLQDAGALTVDIGDSQELRLGIHGDLTNPVLEGRAEVSHGTLAFTPNAGTLPSADVVFNRLVVTWNSDTDALSGAFTIEDGTLTHKASGLGVDQVACALRFDRQRVRVDPMTARFRESLLSGSIDFDYVMREGTVRLGGTIPQLDTLPLQIIPDNVVLTGSAHVDMTATIASNRYHLDAAVDAGQARIACDWWFDKPAGVGASGQVTATIQPRKHISVTVDGEVAATQLAGTVDFEYQTKGEQRWRAVACQATSPALDVVTVGKCLRIPYRIAGGTGTGATYAWRRLGPERWEMEATGHLDRIELLAEGGDTPIRLAGADVAVALNKNDNSTGTLHVTVADAIMPAFGEVWFVPMRTDPDLLERYPPTPRAWTYELRAAKLALPPWSGTNFRGTAYTNDDGGGLQRYTATVDEGEVEGSYHSVRASNAYESATAFRNVPVQYLLDHLSYPPMMTGRITGDVNYSLDRDDPGTLQGTAQFDVRDGQVDTTYFFSQLEGQSGGMPALPPALPFDLLHADVEFQRDVVRTPRVQLLSQGLSMDASGGFIRDGDMDYDLKVAISPETAQNIPVLRENFNIEGHRISQKNLELAFKVSGPTINPRGQISGLPPASVTLVSGALGITSEAVKLIDTPRRILVDLLKMGGGILGAQGR